MRRAQLPRPPEAAAAASDQPEGQCEPSRDVSTDRNGGEAPIGAPQSFDSEDRQLGQPMLHPMGDWWEWSRDVGTESNGEEAPTGAPQYCDSDDRHFCRHHTPQLHLGRPEVRRPEPGQGEQSRSVSTENDGEEAPTGAPQCFYS